MPPGCNFFSETQTIHFKKANKSPWSNNTFYFEDDQEIKVDFNVETLTFSK